MGLKRHDRLRRHEDVVAVRKSGVAYRHPLVVLLVRPNDLSHNRFGFSASRSVGNAVIRNRTKRRFREAVRPLIPSLEKGWDCLFILRKQSAMVDFGDISKATHKLFSRAKLWRDEVLS